MDFLPIAVLLLLVLVGGGIAVLADHLGRKIGKSKRTIHRRIRPRHSAMIITFIVGMLVTFMSIAIITIASSDVRAWLIEGRRALAENKRIVQEQQQLKQANQEQRKINAEMLRANGVLLSTNTELGKKNGELAAQNKDIQGKLNQAEKQLASLESQLKKSRSDLAAAVAQSSGAMARAASAQAQLTSAQQRLTTAAQRLTKVQKDLADKQQEFARVQANYVALVQDSNEQLQRNLKIDQELAEKTAQLEEVRKEVQKLQAEFTSLSKERDDLTQEIERQRAILNVALSTGQETIRTQRFQPVTFSKDEEILRVSVPAGSSKQQVRDLVDRVIVLASNEAKARGAGADPNIGYANIIPLPDQQGRILSSEAQKDMLASLLAGSDTDQLIIAFSAVNAFKGEGVILNMVHAPNPLVYRPGQILAEVRFDSRVDKTEMLKALNDLAGQVRQRALRDKMIPVQDGQSTFGSFTSEQILELYDEVREQKREVRVRAVVKQQTRAGDPLVLSFVVR